MIVQEATAKALLGDRDAMHEAPQGGDVLGAYAILMDAYNTGVRPLVAGIREEIRLDPRPLEAHRRSGYAEPIASERIGGVQARWDA
jgi:L-rhamnose isomerase/sugar isomerase